MWMTRWCVVQYNLCRNYLICVQVSRRWIWNGPYLLYPGKKQGGWMDFPTLKSRICLILFAPACYDSSTSFRMETGQRLFPKHAWRSFTNRAGGRYWNNTSHDDSGYNVQSLGKNYDQENASAHTTLFRLRFLVQYQESLYGQWYNCNWRKLITGEPMAGIFLDFLKAYNTLPRPFLQAAAKRLGIVVTLEHIQQLPFGPSATFHVWKFLGQWNAI